MMPDTSCNLNNCFLCRNCIPEWKELIAQKKKTISIKKGKSLFTEGEKVTGIYFMYSGLIKVHKHWTEDRELIVRFAIMGDMLGHRGIVGNDKYPVSATAISESKVCYISNDFLETTVKTNANFTYRLMHFYASELQKADQRMRNLALMEVKGRIAEALLDLTHLSKGLHEKENIITLNRQDIASYAGTTYETVFKFFNELLKEKIISTEGKTIKINKPEKLKSFIENTN